jgi:hypothetical protein
MYKHLCRIRLAEQQIFGESLLPPSHDHPFVATSPGPSRARPLGTSGERLRQDTEQVALGLKARSRLGHP